MKTLLIFFIVAAITVAAGCSTKYSASNRSYKKQVKALAKNLREYPVKDTFLTSTPWIGTTNFGMRKPNFVIIHHTAQNSCDQTLQTFTLTRTQVSAHYVICKDGTVHHMLNDYLRAWHAGAGKWGNLTDINSSSIGIELDNNGFEPFDSLQINSLVYLLGSLKRQHNIPATNFIGHGDIAPGRKVDPNAYFPWQKLADNGYGLWYGDTTYITVPEGFNTLTALRVIGYDIKDTSAAIAAFKRHFEQQDSSTFISESDKKILFDLSGRYQ